MTKDLSCRILGVKKTHNILVRKNSMIQLPTIFLFYIIFNKYICIFIPKLFIETLFILSTNEEKELHKISETSNLSVYQ